MYFYGCTNLAVWLTYFFGVFIQLFLPVYNFLRYTPSVLLEPSFVLVSILYA